MLLNAIYFIQTITGLNYQCVFVNKLTVPATRISDTNVMCNINSGQVSVTRAIIIEINSSILVFIKVNCCTSFNL